MIVGWRLCRAPFAALDGEGARRFGGRWNSPGRPVVYFADHPALAVLEVIVHLDVAPDDLPDDYVLLKVSLPEREDRAVASNGEPARVNPLHPAASETRLEASTPFRFDTRLLRSG